MTPPPKILVIIGSMRPQRLGPEIAGWVADIGRQHLAADFEVIDLKDWPLPMDEEPGIPAMADYRSDHTRRWSDKVAQSRGFVFVTPQYNWGYPAPLKNALDHLYGEWAAKPAMIVTYGGHGGDKCARQLRQVLRGLKMHPVKTMPGLTLSHERIKANTGQITPAAEFAGYRPVLGRAFAQLAGALKPRRLPGWLWPF